MADSTKEDNKNEQQPRMRKNKMQKRKSSASSRNDAAKESDSENDNKPNAASSSSSGSPSTDDSKEKKNGQKSPKQQQNADSSKARSSHQQLVTRASEYKSYKQQRIHELQDSLFSSTSNYRDFSGFMNLAIILLVISNARMFLENLMKYGLLVDPVQWVSLFLRDPHSWPNTALIAATNIYIFIAYGTEKLLSKKLLPAMVGSVVHVINCFLLLSVPAYFTWIGHPPPTASCFCLVWHAALFCKLYSYAQTNKWYRQGVVEADKLDRSTYFENYDTDEGESVASRRGVGRDRPVKYPENITLRNMYYFVFAPTLCYEANFPRTKRIRPYFVLRRLCEVGSVCSHAISTFHAATLAHQQLFLLQLILGSIQQWIIPTIMNSKKPLTQMNYFHLTERLLKLAVPNHICWLMGFYCMFHSQLNLVAELLRFGDRQFYMDWWNSESITRFWRTWNIPVHRFCVRHVYCPLIECGLSRQMAGLAVFLLSAFFHEYFISVPLKMFRVWAFVGMAAQVPLSMLIDNKIKGRWANIIVWLSIIMGQPLAEMMYFHDMLYRDADKGTSIDDMLVSVHNVLLLAHVFVGSSFIFATGCINLDSKTIDASINGMVAAAEGAAETSNGASMSKPGPKKPQRQLRQFTSYLRRQLSVKNEDDYYRCGR